MEIKCEAHSIAQWLENPMEITQNALAYNETHGLSLNLPAYRSTFPTKVLDFKELKVGR